MKFVFMPESALETNWIVWDKKFSMFLGLLLAAVLLLIDLELLDIPLLAEDHPNFNNIYLLRTFLIAIGSALVVIAVAKFSFPQQQHKYNFKDTAWKDWGRLSWFLDRKDQSPYFSFNVKLLFFWTLLLLSVMFVLIFLVNPNLFYILGSEDRPIELFSAFIQLLNSSLFVYITLKIYRHWNNPKKLNILFALSLAFVFFLIGMEEISWFQRYLGIETPAMFSENIQDEMNLHNFATNKVENIYYFSNFILLIFIPFLVENIESLKRYDIVKIFAPSPYLIYIGSFFISYNYDMWNISLTQVTFFITLFILLYFFWLARKNGESGFIELTTLFVLVFTQLIFLVFGTHFVRLHDITEYKELIIPIACLFYVLEILCRVWKHTDSRDVAPVQ